MVGSRKELEMVLSSYAKRFSRPKRWLEQYPTDGRTASLLLWEAFMRGDLESKIVADLGCGTGILAYGALLLGASMVLCIDIDLDALRDASETLGTDPRTELIQLDVLRMRFRRIDTVVMNPPFGVVRKGIDVAFLRSAFSLSPRAVYSIHKHNPESRRVIESTALSFGYEPMLLAVSTMMIPQMYETHVKRVHRFEVAVYLFRRVDERSNDI